VDHFILVVAMAFRVARQQGLDLTLCNGFHDRFLRLRTRLCRQCSSCTGASPERNRHLVQFMCARSEQPARRAAVPRRHGAVHSRYRPPLTSMKLPVV
jgi:hypothetical protein